MKKAKILVVGLVASMCVGAAYADREDQMWQQYRAQKGMQELDAEFNEPAPQPQVIERVVEKVVVQQVPVPVPASQPSPQSEPMPEPAASPSPDGVTVESDGYVFNISACQLAHGNIKCQLAITAMGKDGDLTLYANYGGRSSKLFDQVGNEYIPANISIGNKGHTRYFRKQYIAGIRSLGAVEFEAIDSATQQISMLELGLTNHNNRKNKHLKFRNLNLVIQ